uniref:Pre-mRNA-processing factor 17 n=1 Tax=Oryza rufipogon TaxID=4529 RepID=A0A0E0NW60_ORYRU
MDLLQSSYTPDDEDDDEQQPLSSPDASPLRLPAKSAAPAVDDTALALSAAAASTSRPLDPSLHLVPFNPTADQLWAPVLGPQHPHAPISSASGNRNHKLGHVEDAAVLPFLFDEQYNTFHRFGYAADPSGLHIVGDAQPSAEPDTVYNLAPSEHKRRRLQSKDEEGANQEPLPPEAKNPASDEWILRNKQSPWAGKKEAPPAELTEEQRQYAEAHAAKKAEKEARGEGKGEKSDMVAKSTFHGKEERDYQGRSWITPPKDAKASNERCYIPKRCVHEWVGHTKGVSAIRFFPKYGHLLLSASMDCKIKIWDVLESRTCMRTYMGHSKAVRDISFSNDGTKFLSAGYDRNIQYWDTETGQVISTFSTGKVPYVVKLNPDEDKQHVLLAGMSDKKIVQWDMKSGQITQEYDQHLGAVNTITFVDNNRRFVTSSDDKSLRVWEFGIPVVIKYISEPHMHSMPSISLHPNSNWLAAQSLDNQILIYSTKERFQLNKKKRFAGHIVAGYACQVNFSPDGRFVMSGDGEGFG